MKFGPHSALDIIVENKLQKELSFEKQFQMCQMLEQFDALKKNGILKFGPRRAPDIIVENKLQKELGFRKAISNVLDVGAFRHVEKNGILSHFEIWTT